MCSLVSGRLFIACAAPLMVDHETALKHLKYAQWILQGSRMCSAMQWLKNRENGESMQIEIWVFASASALARGIGSAVSCLAPASRSPRSMTAFVPGGA
mmetsp:Transcript_21212/g.73043  ORF Transcript_21212/g.73043 Transcript_21212/m.73043 type:complete len:99 (-) Transcript_21212:436-732(-)